MTPCSSEVSIEPASTSLLHSLRTIITRRFQHPRRLRDLDPDSDRPSTATPTTDGSVDAYARRRRPTSPPCHLAWMLPPAVGAGGGTTATTARGRRSIRARRTAWLLRNYDCYDLHRHAVPSPLLGSSIHGFGREFDVRVDAHRKTPFSDRRRQATETGNWRGDPSIQKCRDLDLYGGVGTAGAKMRRGVDAGGDDVGDSETACCSTVTTASSSSCARGSADTVGGGVAEVDDVNDDDALSYVTTWTVTMMKLDVVDDGIDPDDGASGSNCVADPTTAHICNDHGGNEGGRTDYHSACKFSDAPPRGFVAAERTPSRTKKASAMAAAALGLGGEAPAEGAWSTRRKSSPWPNGPRHGDGVTIAKDDRETRSRADAATAGTSPRFSSDVGIFLPPASATAMDGDGTTPYGSEVEEQCSRSSPSGAGRDYGITRGCGGASLPATRSVATVVVALGALALFAVAIMSSLLPQSNAQGGWLWPGSDKRRMNATTADHPPPSSPKPPLIARAGKDWAEAAATRREDLGGSTGSDNHDVLGRCPFGAPLSRQTFGYLYGLYQKR